MQPARAGAVGVELVLIIAVGIEHVHRAAAAASGIKEIGEGDVELVVHGLHRRAQVNLRNLLTLLAPSSFVLWAAKQLALLTRRS